ncbi:Uncharacterised protein [Bordetella pertussis]|nr:Uncharacterised protein [Bordetella pertussis]
MSGTPSTWAVTVSGTAIGSTSPVFMRISSPMLEGMWPNSATRSMSALRTWRCSCCAQRWSTSSSAVSCSGRVSRSRTGSIIE